MLGTREPEIYGYETLSDLEKRCKDKASACDFQVEFKQSNHEGQLVEWIQDAVNRIDGLVINAAAYTHTSVAIHDALKLLSCPIIDCLLYTSPSPRDQRGSRMPSSA